jgi:threonine dehydrogenase-like Zn-dependent dehydrogenase
MIQNGEIDPLKMVTHRVDLLDLEQVYEMFEGKKDGMQKTYVVSASYLS